ncbi:MAG: hypothetical protein JW722_03530 [Demequinaceae bacterium]|nr:hypothetical protein [Demequinaceae bacterium]
MADSPTPKVLCVCTSNLCRSVGMQLFLARSWKGDAIVSSAGTYAMVGWAVPDLALKVMASEGLDASAYEPTQLTVAVVEEADLVLVAASENRAWIAQRMGTVPSNVFLLAEASALTVFAMRPQTSDRKERIRLAAAALDSARAQLTDVRHENLLDPNELNYEAHAEALRQCKKHLDAITAWVG